MAMLKDRRARSERKRQHHRQPGEIVVYRVGRRPGTHSLYHGVVPDRRIDREAWAALLNSLIQTESRGKKATFARLVGVDPKSINLWLARAVDVSEESVRRIARALGRSAIDMLVQVGYYSAAELEHLQSAPVDLANDPAMEMIRDSDFPPRVKRRMVERLIEIRAAQQARELEEVRWWIQQQREA